MLCILSLFLVGYGSLIRAQNQFALKPAPDQCHTVVDCGGDSGTQISPSPFPKANVPTVPATITSITTTMGNGIQPTDTLTLTETPTEAGGTTTILVVLPASTSDDAVHATLLPGSTGIAEIPKPEDGQPDSIFTVPGAPKPTSQSTVTITRIPDGLPQPAKATLLPGPPPVPGGDVTSIYVPGAGEEFAKPSDWTCACATASAQVVTVTRQPEPGPTVESKLPDGNLTTVPASKFPCSSDDKNPCKGSQVQPWYSFTVGWTADFPRPGPPKPFYTTSNFETDTILTLTDDLYQAEHFKVTMDEEVIGETHENGWKNDKIYCGKNADECMAKGWSHGSFLIPKGKHDLGFQWTEGKYQTEAGGNWWYGAGQYRFDKPCSC